MTRKYKLRCFYCGKQFESKKDVYRCNKEALCKECMTDIIHAEPWEESAHNWLLGLTQKYGSYEKAMKQIVYIKCPCGETTGFEKGIKDGRYCYACGDEINV